MKRRFHVPEFGDGDIHLGESESRHARDVLRLKEGDEVEVFDNHGGIVYGVILQLSPRVIVRPDVVRPIEATDLQLTVASAVPKGERADWLIEKLSELGCVKYVPLATARSVVSPGAHKRERWKRIAIESAKQSRRRIGVMQVDELTEVPNFVTWWPKASYLEIDAEETITTQPWSGECALMIGPEGGWTEDELRLFRAKGLRALRLTTTTLRIETAAIAAAAVVLTLASSNRGLRS